MGFTTGFLGGATLTYSVLYLTIYLHKANRNVQHTILQQSNSLLNSVAEPPEPIPDPPPYELKRAGLTEQLKDGWNREIEKMVRKIQTTEWTEQREIYEQRIASAWSSLKQTEQAKDLEQKVKDAADSAKSTAKDVAEKARDTARDVADRARDTAREAADKAKDAARDAVDSANRELAKDKTKIAQDKVRGKRLLELD